MLYDIILAGVAFIVGFIVVQAVVCLVGRASRHTLSGGGAGLF